MDFDAKQMDFDAPFLPEDACVDALPVSAYTTSNDGLEYFKEFDSMPDDHREEGPRSNKSTWPESFAQGKAAEERFIAAARASGFDITPSSDADDCYRKIDVVCKNDKGYLYVDVKGKKMTTRDHLKDYKTKSQYRYAWFELHRMGSLWAGQSSTLALEVDDGVFALFPKHKLRPWLEERLRGKTQVRWSRQALLRPYRRPGRLTEWTTMVDLKDIAGLACGVVQPDSRSAAASPAQSQNKV